MNVEILFKQYYPRLRNYAIRFVGDTFVAEDIVQECFVKLYEKRFKYSDVSPAALLFVMVRNSCLNFLKRKSVLVGEPSFTIPSKITADDTLMYAELKSEILRIVNTLPPKCREVFNMKHFEGLNTREIAERTNTSMQNVEKHLANAQAVFLKHFSGLDVSSGGLI